MLGVSGIFLLILAVDVILGPLITLVLAHPWKSKRELVLDLGLTGLIQIAALIYGMHAVWTARPVVLAFENDRLTIVRATEIDKNEMLRAPEGLRKLPLGDILKVGTRKPSDNAEFLRSIELSLAGVSPAMRPSWWVPQSTQYEEMRERAKPLAALMAKHPKDLAELEKAALESGHSVDSLTYLPLTSSNNLQWVAILDPALQIVGYAPVDGFDNQ